MTALTNERDAISRSLAELTAYVIEHAPMPQSLHERLIHAECRDMFAHDEQGMQKSASHIAEALRHMEHETVRDFLANLLRLDEQGLIDRQLSSFDRLLDHLEERVSRSHPPEA